MNKPPDIRKATAGVNWTANEDGAQVPGDGRHIRAGNAEIGTFLPGSQTSTARRLPALVSLPRVLRIRREIG